MTVSFKKSAVKEVQALPKKIQQKVVDAVQLLALNPYTELLQIKKLKGAEDFFRIRIGDYGVIYHVNGKRVQVIII